MCWSRLLAKDDGKRARALRERERDQFPGTIEYGFIDLMDVKGMMACMQKRKDSLGEADDQ